MCLLFVQLGPGDRSGCFNPAGARLDVGRAGHPIQLHEILDHLRQAGVELPRRHLVDQAQAQMEIAWGRSVAFRGDAEWTEISWHEISESSRTHVAPLGSRVDR